MPTVYLSGRTRTIRLRITLMIEGKIRYNSLASDGGSLGVGSDYSTIAAGYSAGQWDGYSEAFGVRLAASSKLLTADPFGPRTRAVGLQVPSLYNNGFIPLVHMAAGLSVSFICTIDRVMQLVEVFTHLNNGERSDRFGPAGTCYERYTVEGQTFYKYDETFGMGSGGPGHGLNATFSPGIGYYGTILARSERIPFGAGGVNGGDIEASWSAQYIDEDGNPIMDEPTPPITSNGIGQLSWGSVRVNGSTTLGNRIAQASVAHFPRHAFEVEIAPLSLPSGAPVVQHHRLQVERTNPFGGITPTTGTDYFSAGGIASLLAGGTRWSGSLSSTVSGDVGATVTANDFLPLITRLSVSHVDARGHYQCRVRSPFDALTLSQASGVNVPGGAGLSCPVGVTSLSLGGVSIGYRYLRVTAKTPVGTGSLLVESFLNGDAGSPTASQTLTTTVANTDTVIEIDLLEVAGSTFLPDLEIDTLQFTATGNNFTITSLDLFRRDESIVQCMSTYLSLPPIQMPNITGWIEGYTDGIRSLTQALSGNTSGVITLSSLTLRQLVAEINGTTRHNYSSWDTGFPYIHVDGGAAPSPSALLGWSATDAAPPRGGKPYGSSETYLTGDWSDSDVPTPAIHGEGVIGSSLLLTGNATGGITIQAQRFGTFVIPGYLPGNAGFDGTDGADFGDSDTDASTPVRFVGLFRGAAHGMQVGTPAVLPINETDQTIGGSSSAITPPNYAGVFELQTAALSMSQSPLQGTNSNYGDGYHVTPGFEFVENTIDNSGGTNTSEVVYPYHRQRNYVRFWIGVDSGMVLIGSAHSSTQRTVRAIKGSSDDLYLEFKRLAPGGTVSWERVTTSLTLTGGGALSFDRHGAEQRLWLDYEDSGGIKSRYTDDEGTTFSVATTITATGDYPALTHSPTSARHHFWIDGTAIKTLIQDSQGNTLTAAATVVASGVASSPIAATHDGETIILTYVNGSGQVISVISSNGGITFS